MVSGWMDRMEDGAEANVLRTAVYAEDGNESTSTGATAFSTKSDWTVADAIAKRSRRIARVYARRKYSCIQSDSSQLADSSLLLAGLGMTSARFLWRRGMVMRTGFLLLFFFFMSTTFFGAVAGLEEAASDLVSGLEETAASWAFNEHSRKREYSCMVAAEALLRGRKSANRYAKSYSFLSESSVGADSSIVRCVCSLSAFKYTMQRKQENSLPLDHIRPHERVDGVPAVLDVLERLGAGKYDLARKKDQGHDLEVRVPKNKPREDVRLVRRVDVVPLVERLDVEDLPVAHRQLAVAHHVLDLEPRHAEPLPRARLAEQAADAVGGQKGLGGRLGPGDDQLPRREQQDRAVGPHKPERHRGELPPVERREPEDLLEPVQLQRRRDLDLRGGHDVVDEGDRLRVGHLFLAVCGLVSEEFCVTFYQARKRP